MAYNGSVPNVTESKTQVLASIRSNCDDLDSRITDGAPSGAVSQFAGSSSPSGWLLCDGTAVSRTTYSALFAVISTTYGVGDGSTTFNVPNCKGKAVVGFNSGETEFDALGKTGGTKTHALSAAELAAHTHSFSATTSDVSASHTHDMSHSHSVNLSNDNTGTAENIYNTNKGNTTTATVQTSSDGGTSGVNSAGHTHSLSGTSGSEGSGTAHQNLQPYITLNYIIKI